MMSGAPTYIDVPIYMCRYQMRLHSRGVRYTDQVLTSTSNQSSKPCTVLQYPSTKVSDTPTKSLCHQLYITMHCVTCVLYVTISHAAMPHYHRPYTPKGWWRPIGCLKSQVIFRKRATNCRALLREMTYKDTASYDTTPPCKRCVTCSLCHYITYYIRCCYVATSEALHHSAHYS